MKSFILSGSSIIIIGILITAITFINKKNEIPANHLEVVLRDIGHQLLLSVKDSTSRVLPINKLSGDNSIKIINVHGRGYKFMME